MFTSRIEHAVIFQNTPPPPQVATSCYFTMSAMGFRLAEAPSNCTTNCRPCIGDNLCKILQTSHHKLSPPAQIIVGDNLYCSCRSQFLISLATICAGKMKPNCTNCRHLHKLSSVAVFKLQKIMTITEMMMMMMMMMMIIMMIIMMILIISVGGLEVGLGVGTNSSSPRPRPLPKKPVIYTHTHTHTHTHTFS